MEAVDIAFGIAFMLLGTFFAVFHKLLSDWTAEFYSELFGLKSSKFDRKATELMFLIIGIVFIVIGFLGSFQIIRFKGMS